jgi:hypothetical protein
LSGFKRLFCSIRKEWVAALPEELVRQRLLLHMIEEKGFPASLIAVEQLLRQLPHLSPAHRQKVPNRRADIVCYAKELHPTASLYPLLIVECKSIKLTPPIMNQIAGYNHFVGSSFIAIANQEEIRTGWYDGQQKEYRFVDFLPLYSDLLRPVTHVC